MEIWKDIPNYDGIYQVSNLGRVKGLPRTSSKGQKLNGGIRKLQVSKKGYVECILCKEGKQKLFRVHQLVAMAFLEHKPSGMDIVIDHLDNNKLNNNVNNLQAVTSRENTSRYIKKINGSVAGVSVAGNGWSSFICIDGKQHYLGFSKTKKEASKKYNQALKNINNGLKVILPPKRKESSSYKGVSFAKTKGKWKAVKSINGKLKYIGYYETELEAYNARLKFETKNPSTD